MTRCHRVMGRSSSMAARFQLQWCQQRDRHSWLLLVETRHYIDLSLLEQSSSLCISSISLSKGHNWPYPFCLQQGFVFPSAHLSTCRQNPNVSYTILQSLARHTHGIMTPRSTTLIKWKPSLASNRGISWHPFVSHFGLPNFWTKFTTLSESLPDLPCIYHFHNHSNLPN